MTSLTTLDNNWSKPELLAPAGDLEKLRMAVLYGADAVYLGGKGLSLRAGAGNFSLEEMAEGVAFAHARGVRVYVAVNIFAHNRDLEIIPGYLRQLKELGVDGLIVSDPGVIALAQATVPDLPLHLSTQANTINWASARFWADQGIKRIILGRELTLDEIRTIRDKVDIENISAELEIFVHGAMCLSYSGRCYLSRYFNRRDANEGDCSQPCRWRYVLMEEKRPGHYLPVEQDERGTYLLSSKDLCLLPYLPEIVASGIDSLKIEGRMKSVHYVATVVRAYRQALDAFWADPAGYVLDPNLLAELDKVSHREYTSAFYMDEDKARQEADRTISLDKGYVRSYDFVGLVLDYEPATGVIRVEQRDPFRVGDTLEIIGPKSPPFLHKVEAMWNEAGEMIQVARHPQEKVTFQISQPVEPWSLVRRPKHYS
ncbi:MAG: U32 family peptidase [Syntrophomonadaceae bacterium]|nr:U32 family peptidase [Syntrophomonadaceae bacterium]